MPDGNFSREGAREAITLPQRSKIEVSRPMPVTRVVQDTGLDIERISTEIQKYQDTDLARSSAPMGRLSNIEHLTPTPKTSDIFAKAKNVVVRISDWFRRRTARETSSVTSLKETKTRLSEGELLRGVERVEMLTRDVPTQLLSGTNFKGEVLSASMRTALLRNLRKEGDRITDAETMPRRMHGAIRHRLEKTVVGKNIAIEQLARAREFTGAEVEDVDMTEALHLLTQELPKRVTALRMNADTLNSKQKLASEALRSITDCIGGGKNEREIANRVLRTYEAAAKLPLMDMQEGSKEVLGKDYAHRLTIIESALPVNPRLKQAMVFVRERLEQAA